MITRAKISSACGLWVRRFHFRTEMIPSTESIHRRNGDR
jgi:hypothetical protein